MGNHIRRGIVVALALLASLSCKQKQDGADGGPSLLSAAPLAGDKAAEQVLVSYMGTEKCTDRLPFILDPEKNRSVLTQHYSDTISCKKKCETIDASDCLTPTDSHCDVKVIFGKSKNALGGEVEDSSWYCVVLGPTPKVDWRCSVGYDPMPLKTFKALYEKGKPSNFRLFAELDNYYNYEFSDAKDKMYSLKLSDRDGESIAGYVDKTSEAGKKLFELLKDGKSHAVALELTYKNNSRDSSLATVTNRFGYGWREFPEELR